MEDNGGPPKVKRLPLDVSKRVKLSSSLCSLPQVLEELVCNSIDAEAKRIEVSLNSASLEIKVTDDGCGMSREDLNLLGSHNATSKTDSDLENIPKYLGFRGESLQAIMAFSFVGITTRKATSPFTYVKVVAGGEPVTSGLSQGHHLGTEVLVQDLFFKLPVRQNLLLNNKVKEVQEAKERVLRLALVHPSVQFNVHDPARKVTSLDCPATLSLRDRVSQLFGSGVLSHLKEIHYTKGGFEVSGFVSSLSTDQPTAPRKLACMYLNRRFVDKSPLHKALRARFLQVSAAQSGTGRAKPQPLFVLNFSCPRALYEASFEPSQCTVEFKDWSPIVSFLDEVLSDVWVDQRLNNEHTSRQAMGDAVQAVLGSKRQRRLRAAAPWQKVDPTYKPSYSVRVAVEREQTLRAPVDSVVHGRINSKGGWVRHAGSDNRAKLDAPAVVSLSIEGVHQGPPVCGSHKGRISHANSVSKATPDAPAGIANNVGAFGGVRGPDRGSGVGSAVKGRGEGDTCGGAGQIGRDVSRLGPRWAEPLLPCSKQQVRERIPMEQAEKVMEGGKRVQDQRCLSLPLYDDEVQEGGEEVGPQGKELEVRRCQGPLLPSADEAGQVAQRKVQGFWSAKIADTAIRWHAGGTETGRAVGEEEEEEDEDGSESSVLSLPDIASNRRVSSALTARLLPSEVSRDALHRARAVGQIDCKYIAASAAGVLFLVDQHAADERILLEDLQLQVLKQGLPSVHLDTLSFHSVTPGEEAVLQRQRSLINRWGWRFSLEHRPPQDATCLSSNLRLAVTGVPTYLKSNLTGGDLVEYLQQLMDCGGAAGPPAPVLRLLASKACRGAIMFGDELKLPECRQLLQHLKAADFPFQCAHGRPTIAPIVDVPALRGLLAKLPHTNPYFHHSTSFCGGGNGRISAVPWTHRLQGRGKGQKRARSKGSRMQASSWLKRKRACSGAQQRWPVVEVSLRRMRERIADARLMME